MEIRNDTPDDALLSELGSRLRQARINQNISQAEVAARAGITEVTLRAIESGSIGQTRNLLKVLRVLGFLDRLEAVVPPQRVSPIIESDRKGKRPTRVSRRRNPEPREWRWEEEE